MESRSHKEIQILVERVKSDDLKAFGELYECYSSKIYRRCFFMLKNKAKAEDVVHDVFLKILAKIQQLDEGITFDAWLNRLVYNHCIDVLRKSEKINTNDWDDTQGTTENLAIVIENLQSNERLTDKLKQALNELSEIDRTVIAMHYWEGYSVKEIAEFLDLGESAIKMRMKRSRDKIKTNFGEDREVYQSLMVLLVLQLIK